MTLRVRTSEALKGGEIQAEAWLTLKAPPPAKAAALGAPDSGQLRTTVPIPTIETGGEVAGRLPLQGSDPAMALTRLEFEYSIPLADAEAMLALTPHQVVKRRHGLNLAGGDWVLDVFEGDNAPLVVAEVELDQEDRQVTPPPWCGVELTGRRELSNAALAVHPLACWSEAERRALLRPLNEL